MSQHSQRTQHGPSRTAVIKAWIATALPIPMAAYIQSAPGLDFTRMAMTATLALALTGLFLVAAMRQGMDRRIARERAERVLSPAERPTTGRRVSGPSPSALKPVPMPVRRLGVVDTQRLDLP